MLKLAMSVVIACTEKSLRPFGTRDDSLGDRSNSGGRICLLIGYPFTIKRKGWEIVHHTAGQHPQVAAIYVHPPYLVTYKSDIAPVMRN